MLFNCPYILISVALLLSGATAQSNPDIGNLTPGVIHQLLSVINVESDEQNVVNDILRILVPMLSYPEELKKQYQKRHKLSTIPIRSKIQITSIIPETFDSRKKWPTCEIIDKPYIEHTGKCFSNWVTAPVWMMSDRYCIQTGGKVNLQLSGQDVFTCCTNCSWDETKGPCWGGDSYLVMDYAVNHGIVTGSAFNSSWGCQPFSDRNLFETNLMCKNECNYNYHFTKEDDKRFAKAVHRLDYYDVEQIKFEIMNHGPVLVVIGFPLPVMDDNYKDPHLKRRGRQIVSTSGFVLAGKIIGWQPFGGNMSWMVRFPSPSTRSGIVPIDISHKENKSESALGTFYVFVVEMVALGSAERRATFSYVIITYFVVWFILSKKFR